VIDVKQTLTVKSGPCSMANTDTGILITSAVLYEKLHDS